MKKNVAGRIGDVVLIKPKPSSRVHELRKILGNCCMGICKKSLLTVIDDLLQKPQGDLEQNFVS